MNEVERENICGRGLNIFGDGMEWVGVGERDVGGSYLRIY